MEQTLTSNRWLFLFAIGVFLWTPNIRLDTVSARAWIPGTHSGWVALYDRAARRRPRDFCFWELAQILRDLRSLRPIKKYMVMRIFWGDIFSTFWLGFGSLPYKNSPQKPVWDLWGMRPQKVSQNSFEALYPPVLKHSKPEVRKDSLLISHGR